MSHAFDKPDDVVWRARLRACLNASGKTRAQVCGEAGLNPAYLTQILEQKGATPRIDNLSKLAAVLDTTVSYLVDGVPTDPETSEFVDLYGQLTSERKEVAIRLLRDMAAASTEAREQGTSDLRSGDGHGI